MNNIKPFLALRIQSFNRLTFPVILNQIESEKIDQYFNIVLLNSFIQVKRLIKSNVSGLILYSFMSSQLPNISSELSWINKNKRKDLKIMAGGPHTSADPESSLKLGFDFAYVGPAESGITVILEKYLAKVFPEDKTIFYASEVINLNQSLPISNYFKFLPPLEISRGCYWNCQFCQTGCLKTIHRSFETIETYFHEALLRDMYKRISFICPSAFEYGLFNRKELNGEAIEKLLLFFKSNGTTFLEYGIFPSEIRPDTVKEELVDLVVKYCSNKKITIGAQSGNDRQLRQIKRGHSADQVEKACKIIYDRNLQPVLDFILGFPEETPDDRKSTLQMIKKLAIAYGARAQVHYFLPLAGTPYSRSSPSILDYHTINLLKKYKQDGITTDWWRKGIEISLKMQTIRDNLKEQKVNYQKIIVSI